MRAILLTPWTFLLSKSMPVLLQCTRPSLFPLLFPHCTLLSTWPVRAIPLTAQKFLLTKLPRTFLFKSLILSIKNPHYSANINHNFKQNKKDQMAWNQKFGTTNQCQNPAHWNFDPEIWHNNPMLPGTIMTSSYSPKSCSRDLARAPVPQSMTVPPPFLMFPWPWSFSTIVPPLFSPPFLLAPFYQPWPVRAIRFTPRTFLLSKLPRNIPL